MANPLDGYGVKEENLQDILERLSLYCTESGIQNPQITILLPKAAIERFSLQMAPIQREGPLQAKTILQLRTYGTVNIQVEEDYDVIPRRP